MIILVGEPPSVSPSPTSPSSVSISTMQRDQPSSTPPDQRSGATNGMLTMVVVILLIFIARLLSLNRLKQPRRAAAELGRRGDQGLRVAMPGPGDDVRGGAQLADLAGLEHQDAVGDRMH